MALESVSSPSVRSGSLRRRALTPYLFILPFGVLFLLFFVVPILYAIYESLFCSQRSGLGLGAATVSFNGVKG
jgi:multiple sugar transport system permease protein